MGRYFLLNIGNTHTEFVHLTDVRDQLPAPRRLATDELDAATLTELVRDCRHTIAAGVVPAVVERLRNACAPDRFHAVNAAAAAGLLDLSRVDTSTLGADRIANAVAAVRLVGTPVLVLDCGTALTTEAVDSDRCFRGGAIAPGRRLLRNALHDHTAQLPNVPMTGDLPNGLGTTTVAAIRAGVDRGAIGLARELVTAARRELGAPECPVLVTGGDAAFFLEFLSLPGLRAAPPAFTLSGVQALAVQFLSTTETPP
jgi:type III pantothenate kinase